MYTLRIIGFIFIACVIFTWRAWWGLFEIVHEGYVQWRTIQRARYAPTPWKRLLEEIVVERLASGVSGEWELPPELARLSATGTVNITRFPDGMVTLLFTTRIGYLFNGESRIYLGYLVCSRKLRQTDFHKDEVHTTAGELLPFDSSITLPDGRITPEFFFRDQIIVGLEVEPRLYKIDGSYHIGYM